MHNLWVQTNINDNEEPKRWYPSLSKTTQKSKYMKRYSDTNHWKIQAQITPPWILTALPTQKKRRKKETGGEAMGFSS